MNGAPTSTAERTTAPSPAMSTPPDNGPRGGRVVAWAGFVFGSAISIAGNVLYTWIPPVGAAVGWAPTLTAMLFAAVWPIALLLAVEVLSRVRWAPGWQWAAARYGGAGTVALGSAVISYGHLSAVLGAWAYGPVGAAVGPLVLDGLMVVSGFALLSPGPVPAQVPAVAADVPTVAPVLVPAGDAGKVPGPVPDDARSDQPKHRAGLGDEVTDDVILGWLRAQVGEAGKVPGRKAVVDQFGVGATRADRLRSAVQVPARMRRVK